MNSNYKIGYFADGPWSHQAFEKITGDDQLAIAFVCVRFDKDDRKLKELASRSDIPVLCTQDVNSEEFIKEIKEYGCDLYVSMSFNQIFKESFLSAADGRLINCHAGALPFYRGRNVLNWALINGEKRFGITVHFVDHGIDTGDILAQKFYDIDEDDNYKDLLEIAYSGCAALLYDVLRRFSEDNEPERIPQTSLHPTGSYCSGRVEGDENIHFNQNSIDLHNFVRGIAPPGPGAVCFYKTHQVVFERSKLLKDYPVMIGIPGAILNVSKNAITVKTKDSAIKIIEWNSSISLKTGMRLSSFAEA